MRLRRLLRSSLLSLRALVVIQGYVTAQSPITNPQSPLQKRMALNLRICSVMAVSTGKRSMLDAP